jgi:hypothetical protein
MIWNVLNWVSHFLFWGALAGVVFGFFGNRSHARVLSGSRVEFTQDRISLCGWLYLVVNMAWLAVKNVMKSHGNPWDFVIPVMLVSCALMFLFAIPGKVVVSEDGIEEVHWLRKRKRILWKDIVEIESGQKDRMVTITGADGTRIIHSCFLADRPRLLMELKRHCGHELPPDFPREPIDVS